MIRPNLLNCNEHGAKASLLPLRASSFGIKFPLKFLVFMEPLLVVTSSHFMLILCENHRFWDPWKSNGDQHGTTNWPSGANIMLKNYAGSSLGPFFEPTAVPEATFTPQGLIVHDFWTLPGLILNEFRKLLASLLAVNSRIRQKLASTSTIHQFLSSHIP